MRAYLGPRGIQKGVFAMCLSDSIAGFGVFRSRTRAGQELKFVAEIAQP